MRIISLAPSNTEILYALGAEEDILAVTNFCDWPAEAKQKQKIGAWIQTEPIKIAELKPDIILTSYFLPEALREWSGPGEVVHVEPRRLSDIFESIRLIGHLVEKDGRAEELIRTMRQSFEEICEQSPAQRPRIYMEEWPEPPMAAGNWVPELVQIAGGRSVIGKIAEASAAFSFEQLQKTTPAAIICHWCGFGERTDMKRVKDRPEWQSLHVVQENKIFFVDDSLINRPGPRLVDGARALQKIFLGL